MNQYAAQGLHTQYSKRIGHLGSHIPATTDLGRHGKLGSERPQPLLSIPITTRRINFSNPRFTSNLNDCRQLLIRQSTNSIGHPVGVPPLRRTEDDFAHSAIVACC